MTRRCVDIVASCGEDCKVNVWSIPENGLTENLATPTLQFNTHIRKVGHVLFHPSAENILLSSGADLIIKLYDIQQGQEKQDVIGHVDIVNSIAWNWNGSMIATASKDKKIRLIDVRANKVVQVLAICGSTREFSFSGLSPRHQLILSPLTPGNQWTSRC